MRQSTILNSCEPERGITAAQAQVGQTCQTRSELQSTTRTSFRLSGITPAAQHVHAHMVGRASGRDNRNGKPAVPASASRSKSAPSLRPSRPSAAAPPSSPTPIAACKVWTGSGLRFLAHWTIQSFCRRRSTAACNTATAACTSRKVWGR